MSYAVAQVTWPFCLKWSYRLFLLSLDSLSLKKEAKSLHDLVDSSSGETDAEGLVSLSTTVNKVRALLLFLLIISERKICLALFSSKLQI